MKKYFLVARNTWDEVLTYRLSFVMYRIRNVLTFLTMYYLWYALLPEGTTLFGYNQSLILTYIVGTSLLSAFVLSSRSYAIGDDINQGNLSNYLIKPMHYFLYWVAKDIGDKVMNIAFAAVELTILFLLLRPPLVLQTDPFILLLFFMAVLIGIILYFLFNLMLGMVGFWSPEVWAPRFIFMILISFFSGTYFPLDILPEPLFTIFRLLPFQNLLYFPLKVYLHQFSLFDIVNGLLIGCTWIIVLFLLVQLLWKRGLQEYTAQGK